MTAPTLLIDSDIVAYKVASACEVECEFDEYFHPIWFNPKEATEQFDEVIEGYKKKLGATEVIMALTSKKNFRTQILPTYKANRKGVRKPLPLLTLRKHIHESYETYEREGLEADDCLGILATMGKPNQIVVSIDKDLKQIPGLNWNPDKDQGPQEITEDEGNWWHMYQTLVGDSTDNYTGCPGVGPVKAEKILNAAAEAWAGLKPGTAPLDEVQWWNVRAAFEKAGLGEEEALRQARVSRILRSSDYDFITKKPILWSLK